MLDDVEGVITSTYRRDPRPAPRRLGRGDRGTARTHRARAHADRRARPPDARWLRDTRLGLATAEMNIGGCSRRCRSTRASADWSPEWSTRRAVTRRSRRCAASRTARCRRRRRCTSSAPRHAAQARRSSSAAMAAARDVHESRWTWTISRRMLAVLHGDTALDPSLASFVRIPDGVPAIDALAVDARGGGRGRARR